MYYENYKIINVEDKDDKIKKVTLKIPEKENETIYIPDWELAAVMTEEPSDASEVRLKRCLVVVDELYDVFKNHNIRLEDIGFIQQRLNLKLQGAEEKGTNDLLGVKNKYEIRIKHWDKE